MPSSPSEAAGISRPSRERPSSAAILITTNPRRALRAQAAFAGVEIIEKPLLTDALRDSVRSALDAAPR